jgi:hypothetical protein
MFLILLICGAFALNAYLTQKYEEEQYQRRYNELWRLVSSLPYINKPDWSWRNPNKTLREGGDCEDITVAFLVYLNDFNSEMLHVTMKDGTKHAVARVRGRILEPQRYGMYYEESEFKSIDVVFSLSDVAWYTLGQSLTGQDSK